MTGTPETAVVLAGCAIVGVLVQAGGVLVWGIRLEGRVTTNEKVAHRDREEVFNRLTRIEDKLDRALEE